MMQMQRRKRPCDQADDSRYARKRTPRRSSLASVTEVSRTRGGSFETGFIFLPMPNVEERAG